MPKDSHTILVLDDDPDISMMLKLMLEYKNYIVNTAEREEEMLALLNTVPTDLIIMDMLLSGVNGTDVCASLKQNPATNMIPVLMISAHPNAKEICLKSGADEFVAKPFDMHDILDRITSLLPAFPKRQ
jgi:DNA-binding response OmpR family regulator